MKTHRQIALLLALVCPLSTRAQTINWAGGNSFQNWLNPANWSPQIVPTNSPGTNFVVVIGANSSLLFDQPLAAKVGDLRYDGPGTIRMTGGGSLEVANVALLGGSFEAAGTNSGFYAHGFGVTLGAASTFSASAGGTLAFGTNGPGLTLNENCRFFASSGGRVTVGNAAVNTISSAWTWSGDWGGDLTLFQAVDPGSLVNLAALRTYGASVISSGCCNDPWNRRQNLLVAADNGGVIDLSGLQTLTGMRSDEPDQLEFRINNGGDIRLDALQSITGRTAFRIGVPYYRLPSLRTVQNTKFIVPSGSDLDLPALQSVSAGYTEFNIASNGVVHAAALETLDSATMALAVGGAFNAPSLSTVTWSTLALVPGMAFNVPPLTHIDGSRISVSGGASNQIAAASYDWSSSGDWGGDVTLFQASGGGSTLNLPALRTMTANVISSGCCNDPWNRRQNLWVVADGGGAVDLSALETVTGMRSDEPDELEFRLDSSSRLKLDSLRLITGRVGFVLGPDTRLVLPSLASASNTKFLLSINSTIEAPSLTNFDGSYATLSLPFKASLQATQLVTISDATLGLESGSVLTAPKLANLWNSVLNLAPGVTFQTPPLTSVDGSRIVVSGGVSNRIAASSYTWSWSGDWGGDVTLFQASGQGSILNLAAMRTITANVFSSGCCNDPWNRRQSLLIVANSGGWVDLSALETIIGMRSDEPDELRLDAQTGGRLSLGAVVAQNRTRLQATGAGSTIEARRLDLRWPTTIGVSSGGSLRLAGDLTFDYTEESRLSLEDAVVRFEGTNTQWLEVGGLDSGTSGGAANNFGLGQLILGRTNQSSVVSLRDAVDNGNRQGGTPEALYLGGNVFGALSGNGLQILGGSKLILGQYNAYAFLNGQMRSLRSLLPPGSNSVAFDQGFIATAAGPAITNMTPSGRLLPSVSFVDVTFDIPVKASSFTAADVTVNGPSGSISVTGVAPTAGNTWRIGFAPQSADGAYTVRVGPAIDEIAGNLFGMDQKGDGRSGDGTNDTFTGTFTIDGTAPAVVSGLALNNGTRVGVTFSEPIVPAAATNPANYTVNGSQPLAVVLQSDGQSVALDVPPLLGDAFTLAVSNLADALGNTTNRTFAGTILTMDSRDIGVPGSNPAQAGSALTFQGNDFEVRAGGSDFYWGGSDAGHFASATTAGDFDVQVQITGMTTAETYTQAGLMWRESTAADARRIYLCINHPNNFNSCWALIRWSPGAAGVEWPSYTRPAAGTLPNVWLRLKRTGDVFNAFRSSDGTNWQSYATVTAAFARTGLVGPASTARNNGSLVTAWYRNFADIVPTIVTEPQSQSVTTGANVTFAVTARGLPSLGYQWLNNGVPLPGETNGLLQLLGVTTNRVGDYRVIVSNPYGSATSQVAQLVVDNVGMGGFEADLSPAPLGNNAITVADWVKVGRLVAGLDVPLNSSEFARADCAPRTNALLGTLPLGDGRLTVADWTQAGRYAAGVDLLTPAGGPILPAALPPGVNAAVLSGGRQGKDGSSVRSVRLVGSKVVAGQVFTVPVELTALGGENALGFSVQFDPTRLVYQGAALASSAAGASLQVNAAQAGGGNVGVVLAKSIGKGFAAGVATVAQLQFRASGPAGTNALGFGDAPVWREVADVNADVQPASYVTGSVRVVAAGVLSPDVRVSSAGVDLQLTGQAGERYRVEFSADLAQWSLLSEVAAGPQSILVHDASASGGKQRFYRAVLVP